MFFGSYYKTSCAEIGGTGNSLITAGSDSQRRVKPPSQKSRLVFGSFNLQGSARFIQRVEAARP